MNENKVIQDDSEETLRISIEDRLNDALKLLEPLSDNKLVKSNKELFDSLSLINLEILDAQMGIMLLNHKYFK